MTPWAATTSSRAKQAAAIAAAEAREEEEPVTMKKKRGRPKKKATWEPAIEVDDDAKDEEGPVGEEEDINKIVIDWSADITLTWTLITAIETDEEISASIFPGLGAITRKGGKPKTHFYYELARLCFGVHEKYQDAFAKATSAKGKKAWFTKIKNRVVNLVKTTKEYMDEMGATGAGIANEDEIQPGTALITKWDVIKADAPWFFHVRTLIASRPNLQPVGLGNNDMPIDTSLLFPTDDDQSSAPDDTQDPLDLDALSSDSDDNALGGPVQLVDAVKRKCQDDDKAPKAAKKTRGPLPTTSVPTAPSLPTKKAATVTAKDRFAATILAEEETAREALAVKKNKDTVRMEVTLAKIRMEGDARADREESKRKARADKMDLVRLKMEQQHEIRKQEHELAMAQVHQRGSQSYAGSSSGYRQQANDHRGEQALSPATASSPTLRIPHRTVQ
ncbi:hypothetical protein C8J57DRAFT_1532467 [Mycena rebaudengoi]|nr:hypothetical protein C8J57DRAFT_1532467 [Mycena rebaudengoi]